MSKRPLGNIPVFGSDARLGKLQDAAGNVITNDGLRFLSNNLEAYAQGVSEVTPEVFNGAMNYVTNLLSYMMARGVPEFSLNVAYAKGAVVSFDGALYVSLTDNNIKHVSQSSHWGKYVIEPNESHHNTFNKPKVFDNNPIGTILTVPVTAEKEGYIDYAVGNSFDATVYPELYRALGTNKFGSLTGAVGVDLPVGSIVPWLSAESSIPDGFIEWSTTYGVLDKYPELYNVLTKMAFNLPLSDSKTAWNEALRNRTLPMFEASGFFLGYGKQVGSYTTDTVRSQVIEFAPMVVDSSNTLNPLGYSRCAEQQTTVAPVNANVLSRSQFDSPYVILANTSATHASVTDKTMYQVTMGDADATAPKQLAVRLLIKAASQVSASISDTHKQIIKAY